MSRLARPAGFFLLAGIAFCALWLVAYRSGRDAGAIDELNRRLARVEGRDSTETARTILLPSVKVLADGGGVGSGTIVYSRPDRGTYVLTAYHVIERAVRRDGRTLPVEVTVYSAGSEERIEGDILIRDEKKDLALMRLRSARIYPTARLAPQARLAGIGLFTPVYAVGCALGHAPLPSAGEISTLSKVVQGERFWMMSAPTTFGNSGGGVFLRETMELVGVSSMVCTFDSPLGTSLSAKVTTTPVSHLGILTPIDSVAAWLDARGYGFISAPR